MAKKDAIDLVVGCLIVLMAADVSIFIFKNIVCLVLFAVYFGPAFFAFYILKKEFEEKTNE